ncbi:SUMO-protein ligase PIAS3,E3 SUMO- ligase PIAS2,E3 SUMO- ligase PIAS4,E3 SUMO- ligase PIAS1,E3 SUMO- [Octopus vulgaris]|uniref:SUMO-protein ligase PIAS3,E3 SUMO- ligase PIAS2,E3 SUMO- ligase PIAS4,E3 SUMO- ligase PIAS1,E3 SUMO n=1 Tax=Octopus vulgaris TaxID=6645 RepID=A0AA36AR39_OCTVU|nr:SUMO-protein ligase PIAS3,E3 SUMO- ligase PIAS2,E3 SUMO- ligase PIAS4,E3 SUMO- ligase PIAS1,E3 SUMO- [Octopus vulgaris]
MADAQDLKHMIMSFRVSELQVLLGFAGKSKSGRKQELLQRALGLVSRVCSIPVQIKIRELYRRRFPSRNTSPNQNATSQPSSDSGSSSSNFQGKQSSCPIDFSSKHNHSSPVSSLPVHPDVRLKRLPFYDILGELLKPTSLVPKPTGRFQETFFIFHLTPQQAQDIAMSRDFRPGAKCEYTTQVQLRFCLLETSCEQDDNFPPSICVRVNGKLATLPNPIPTTKPGVEPKRPGRPVDITALCRLSPTVPNHVDVSWASEFGRGYCVAVYLVKKLTSDILLQRLKQFGNRHPDHSRALIKEKLQHDPDSEIATTSLRVSLMCPLGKMRLQIPCRCSTCTHLQCFDAFTFLMMNEKKPTWICPVCDKSAAFDKLIIDGLFVEILQQSAGCTEIQFGEDGSWSPLKAVKETLLISSPVIKSSSIPGSPEKKASPQQDVIDLTMDSSSDEEDLTQHVTPSRTPSTSQTSNSSGSSIATSVNSSPAYSNNVYLPQPSLPVITSNSIAAVFGSRSSPVLKSAHSLYIAPTPNFAELSANDISENFTKLPVFPGANSSSAAAAAASTPNPRGNEIHFISI